MDIHSTLVLAIVLAFVLAFIFSMFGQGGGSVYSPVLVLLGYPVLLAASTSLVLNFITSMSAGYVFYRAKMIDLKTSFIFVPGMCIGAFIGGVLSKFANATALLWLFVIFLIGVGAKMLFSYWEKGTTKEDHFPVLSKGMYVFITLFGFAVGFVSGLLGVGGGILIVPFMVYVCKYPTKSAAGSSHLIISFSALAGILGHATNQHLDIPLILMMGVAVLIGGNLGARFSMRFKSGAIKAGLGLLMWALALQIVVKLLMHK